MIGGIFTIAFGAFIIWGVFNDQKLADFEQKIIEKIKDHAERRG